jgi:hypothetical protein
MVLFFFSITLGIPFFVSFCRRQCFLDDVAAHFVSFSTRPAHNIFLQF